MFPRMNCSGKFFEPIVMLLLALAGSFWISEPPEAVVELLLDEELEFELLLLELPHAATARARANAASSPVRTRADRLMWSPFWSVAGGRSVCAGRRNGRTP